MKWSPEETARCTELWNAGCSASKIAAVLGEGYTRSSIISKVHRLKLPQRDTSTRFVSGYKPGAFNPHPRPRLVTAVPPPDEPAPLGEPGELSTRGCKWPRHQQGSPWVNCGHQRHGKTVWCIFHHSRASSPAKSSR